MARQHPFESVDIGQMNGITFGDHAIEIGDIRIGIPTGFNKNLTIASRRAETIEIFQSDGTRHRANSSVDANLNPWNYELGRMQGIKFGDYCIEIGDFFIAADKISGDEGAGPGIDCLCIGYRGRKAQVLLKTGSCVRNNCEEIRSSTKKLGFMNGVAFGNQCIKIGAFRIGSVVFSKDNSQRNVDSNFCVAHDNGTIVSILHEVGLDSSRIYRDADSRNWSKGVKPVVGFKRSNSGEMAMKQQAADVLVMISSNVVHGTQNGVNSLSSISPENPSTCDSTSQQQHRVLSSSSTTAAAAAGPTTTVSATATAAPQISATYPYTPLRSTPVPATVAQVCIVPDTVARVAANNRQGEVEKPWASRLVVPQLPMTLMAVPLAPTNMASFLPQKNARVIDGMPFSMPPSSSARAAAAAAAASFAAAPASPFQSGALLKAQPSLGAPRPLLPSKKRAPRKVRGTDADRFGNVVQPRGRPIEPPSGWFASNGGSRENTDEAWRALSREEQRSVKVVATKGGKRPKLAATAQNSPSPVKLLGQVGPCPGPKAALIGTFRMLESAVAAALLAADSGSEGHSSESGDSMMDRPRPGRHCLGGSSLFSAAQEAR